MVTNPFEKLFEYRDADPDEAKFFWSGGPVEVADRTWFQSMLSGCTAFETDDGIVLIDCGTTGFAPTLAKRVRKRTDKPIHTAIYTHGHVDHAYGLPDFLAPGQAPPRVVAHRNALARFERYERTSGHNRAINARQFGGAVSAGTAGSAFDTFRRPPILPTEIFAQQLTLRVGGLTFELHHCRGETDDHVWAWCPERGVLCPGDLFIYAVPNAGNPQKVQRYPWDWADGLRQMAALRPVSLCPGHGGPVVENPKKIQRMLLETADYLDAVVQQALAALDAGSPPHADIVHTVRPPDTASPWLQPVYDEAEFIARNVIRFYGGWWNGRPSDLKPAPRKDLAREFAQLAGGPDTLVARMRALANAQEWRLASHLADYALEAAPDDASVQTAVADFYRRRAETETSLMAANIFNSAAAYAEEGRPFA